MDNPWYFVIGFVAEGLFAARFIIQWILSEKAKKVVSPTIFWQLSLLASIVYSTYGWLRGDFAIIIGQMFTYYIYIWNLKAKDNWQKFPQALRVIIFFIPIVAIVWCIVNREITGNRLFEHISSSLLAFGTIGQVIFTSRFIYQWWYSRTRHESVLPMGFWIISLIGSVTIFTYGILRRDIVLIVGQLGFIMYARNLWLAIKNKGAEVS